MQPLDTLGRPVRDLRISVTDRCNFRCSYCMPKSVFGQDYRFMDRKELLSFEELERVAKAFVGLGVEKIRLTGGEPLLRKDLETLVAHLAAIEGLDVTLTTNASLLARKAQQLRDAGLDRVNVSLDSLDDATFRAMNDVDFPVGRVLEGIEAAAEVGLPVKVNAVVKRGVNDQGIVDMARHFRDTGHTLRFIEYMDVGSTNGWRLDDVVPAAEIVERIDAVFPLEPVEPAYRGEVAQRWRYRDGAGELGVISSVTQPFCGDCTRSRISAEGKLYTCLFAARGTDLRALIRSGASDEELGDAIAAVWTRRTDRYSEIRTERTSELPRIEMSYIGVTATAGTADAPRPVPSVGPCAQAQPIGSYPLVTGAETMSTRATASPSFRTVRFGSGSSRANEPGRSACSAPSATSVGVPSSTRKSSSCPRSVSSCSGIESPGGSSTALMPNEPTPSERRTSTHFP